MDEVGEWGMALNEDTCIKSDSEHTHELCYSRRLMCTTAVGQEDEGNTLPLEQLKCLRCSCQRLGAPEKDAIDAIRKLEENSGCWGYEMRTQKQRQSLEPLLWY